MICSLEPRRPIVIDAPSFDHFVLALLGGVGEKSFCKSIPPTHLASTSHQCAKKTDDWHRCLLRARHERRAFDRDLIRGRHYGQRSCEPHKQAEHMAAPTNLRREESPCQPGATSRTSGYVRFSA